jgi:hypothetical protein
MKVTMLTRQITFNNGERVKIPMAACSSPEIANERANLAAQELAQILDAPTALNCTIGQFLNKLGIVAIDANVEREVEVHEGNVLTTPQSKLIITGHGPH